MEDVTAVDAGAVRLQVPDYARALADGSIIISSKSSSGRPKPDAVVVRLLKTYPHLGGVRCWFQCPACGRRCRKLYRQVYGLSIGCRVCHAFVYRVRYDKSLSGASTRCPT